LLSLSISFLGASGTVTGSKYLLEREGHQLLVDCGLFQGFKVLRLRNWERLPIDPRSIEHVLLTHAHLDHSGYLPLLAKQGFHGRIYCSAATQELCGILLPDAGHLQEQDAEFANRHGYSKHKPALPLFTEEDARKVLGSFQSTRFHKTQTLKGGASFTLYRAGHILGAASMVVEWGATKVAFSGDLGRYNDALMPSPEPVGDADYIVVESTYGNRTHDPRNPEDSLVEAIAPVLRAGGTVVMPAFAVGRAQSLLYHLDRLKSSGRLPKLVPVYLDSPMALDASDMFCRHPEDHRLGEEECRSFCARTTYVRSVDESKAIMTNKVPKIIISASGMATGGRVLHHLKHYAPDPKNGIVFAGFQAGGTRGAAMVGGAEAIKIHGGYVPVRASVTNIDNLSAHADADEILRWLSNFKKPPRAIFITHGEPTASDALRHRIEETLGWTCVVPDHGRKAELT
jgi:metallo-beta-lactamase family protein